MVILSISSVNAGNTNNTDIISKNNDEPVLENQVQDKLISEAISDTNGDEKVNKTVEKIKSNSNLLKASGGGDVLGDGSTITITSYNADEIVFTLSVSYADNGYSRVGLSASSSSTLSDPFYIYDSSNNTVSQALEINEDPITLNNGVWSYSKSFTLKLSSGTLTPGKTYYIKTNRFLVYAMSQGSMYPNYLYHSEELSASVLISKIITTVTCTVSKPLYNYGDGGFTISGKVSGFNSAYTDKGTLTLYRNGTSLGTISMASDGNYSCSISDSQLPAATRYTYYLEHRGNYYEGNSSKVNVDVNKRTTTINLAVSSSSYAYASTTTITLSGTVSGVVSTLNAGTVNIYRNGSKIITVNVGTNGAYSHVITDTTGLNVGNYAYWAEYAGNDKYEAAASNSSTQNIKVTKGVPVITINPTIAKNTYPGEVTIEVIVKNALGNALEGVLITPNGFNSTSKSTDSNGKVTFNVGNLNASTYSNWKITSTINDLNYEEITNTSIDSFTINKQMTTLSGNNVLVDNLAPGLMLVNVTLVDASGRPLKNIKIVYSGAGVSGEGITDDEGKISFNITGFSGGTFNDLTFTCSDNNYQSNAYTVPQFSIVPNDSFTKLYEAIQAAGDTLNLTHNYRYYDEFDSAFSNDGITINKAILINGNGYTIDAKQKARIFLVNSTGVVLNNLNYKNGHNNDRGGAVHIMRDDVIVSNSSFESNFAAGYGGAIYINGKYNKILNCTFDDNKADVHDGGAICLFTLSNYTTIDSVHITNSYARYVGSAIAIFSSDISISNSYFGGNKDSSLDSQYGGTLGINIGSNFKITNCTFENNYNYFEGAGIRAYSRSSDIEIINSTFINNTAPNGGAISIYGKNVKVLGSKFIDNHASINGGAIYIVGNNSAINDCEFINNRAVSNGGAIYSTAGDGFIAINSNFTKNKVTEGGYGGAIFYNGSSFEIDKCIFVSNSVTPKTGAADWTSRGGAIFTQASSLNKIHNSKFTDNKIDVTSGRFGSGVVQFYGHLFDVYNCTFIGNKAPYGGITNVDVNGGKFESCIFMNNYAYERGGVLNSNTPHSTTVINSIILNNTASASEAKLRIFSVADTSSIVNYYLNYNWWGHNASNYESMVDVIGAYPNKAQLIRWLFLDCESNETDGGYLFPDTKNIRFRFTINKCYDVNTKKVTNYSDISKLPTVTLDLSVVGKGSISAQSTTLNDGIGEYLIFNSTSTAGKTGVRGKYLSLAGYTKIFTVVPINSFMALNITITHCTENTLNLARNYQYYADYDAPLIQGVVINKKITINGKGYTLDAKNSMRIFNIFGCRDVVLNNMIFTQGKHSSQGGAINIASSASRITIANSTIKNNKATNGGAFYVLSANTTIINCTFTSNSGTNNGGAVTIAAQYGLIKDSEFTSNYAPVNGGAMHITGSDFKLINTVFTSNSASKSKGSGGAILWNGANGYVDGCTFTSNTVSASGSNGGAIYWDGKNGAVRNSIFKSNKAVWGGALAYHSENSRIYNTQFISNSASGGGGGVNLHGKNCVIEKCTFTSNQETGGKGSTYGGAGLRVMETGVVVNHCTFTSNAATAKETSGGAILWNAANGILNNTVIKNNNAKYYSGGVYWLGSNGIVDNCLFQSNKAYTSASCGGGGALRITGAGFKVYRSNFTSNTAAKYGAAFEIVATTTVDGCIFTSNNGKFGSGIAVWSTSTIKNSVFNSNAASGDGGAIYCGSNTVTVRNCEFTKNTAKACGGAIYWEAGTGEVHDSVFTENKANNNGGGIQIFASNVKVYNSNFTSNTAKYGGATEFKANGGYVYGCIFTSNTAVWGAGVNTVKNTKVEKSRFIKNVGTTGGAGINSDGDNTVAIDCYFEQNNGNGYTAGFRSTKANAEVRGCVFVENYCDGYGAAVTISGNSGKVLNSNFTSNRAAKNYAAGVYISGKTGTIDNCNFNSNTAKLGAAISLLGSGCKISNSKFNDNIASDYGGAVYMVDSCELKTSVFNNNTAPNYAGAVYVKGNDAKILSSVFNKSSSLLGGAVYVASGNNIIISESKFNNNTARNLAGAVYLNAKGSTIDKSVFNKNTAGDEGGAIYMAVQATINDSNFTQNTVPNYGGAIYIAADGSKIIGGYYNNNSAPVGGAVNVKSKQVTIENATFTNHHAVNGSAIHWKGDDGTLINSVLDNNTASNYGSAVYIVGNNVNVKISNLTGNTAKLGGAIYVAGENANFLSSNFNNNTALLGGAIYLNTLQSTITTTNFTNNSADYGAGIFISKNTTLSQDVFTNNVAKYQGGAGYSYDFIHHSDCILTLFNPEIHRDDFYAAFVKLLNDTIYVGEYAILEVNSTHYRDFGNVTLEIDGKFYESEWLNNTWIRVNTTGLSWGFYEPIYGVYNSTDEYNGYRAVLSLKVKRFPVNATLIDKETNINGNFTIKINETDANGTLTVIFPNGYKYKVNVTNGTAVVWLDEFVLGGDYNITIHYLGDNRYDEYENVSSIRVNKLVYVPHLENNWTYIKGDVGIVLPEDAVRYGGNVSFSINGEVYNVVINSDVVYITLNETIASNIYDVRIWYSGNDKYNETVNLTRFEVRQFPINITLDSNMIEYRTNMSFTITSEFLEEGGPITGNISFTVDGKLFKEPFVYQPGEGVNIIEFETDNITPGYYENVEVTFTSTNQKYATFSKNFNFTIYKAGSKVEIEDVVNGTYNTTYVTINFDVENQTNISVTVYDKDGNIIFHSIPYEDFIYRVNNLSYGVYNITIENIEDEFFTGSQASALFNVGKIASSISIENIVNGTYYTTNVTVEFYVFNREKVNITVYDMNGNIVYNASDVNGDVFTIGDLGAGVYNITIYNFGNDSIEPSNASALFEVYKSNSFINITDIINGTYNTTAVNVNFTSQNTTTIRIIVTRNDTGAVVFDDTVVGNFTISTLSAGIFNITIISPESANYTMFNVSSLFEVFKSHSFVNITDVTNATFNTTSATIKFAVENRTNVGIIITNTETGETIKISNYEGFEFTIGNLTAGVYNITVINNENENFTAFNDTALLNIAKAQTNVSIGNIVNGTCNTSNVTVNFDVLNMTSVHVIVYNNKTGDVVYNNTNFIGNVFNIGNLSAGIYNITIINIESVNYLMSNASAIFKVVVKSSVIAENINRGYNSPYDYYAVFTDELGNPLNNTNVTMVVGDNEYLVTTNENGEAYLTQSNLSVGLYNVTLYNPVTDVSATFTTNIVARLQENNDIVMDFCDGSYYRIRAYGDDGQPIAGVYVSIKINNVTYDVKTDENGYASLKIRLNPDVYTITAEWNDYKVNNIVIKQTLKSKSVSAKKSKDLKFKATLKWSNGKAIVGKNIIFKFKGKKYVAKTNKKGVATIKIKKSVFNKLKAGKKYKISITYKAVDNGYTSVNAIFKTIKIKN